MTYQGHHPDGSSVQRHSAGSHYPFILAARNDRAEIIAPDGRAVFAVDFASQPGNSLPAQRMSAYSAAIDAACEMASKKRRQRQILARLQAFNAELEREAACSPC